MADLKRHGVSSRPGNEVVVLVSVVVASQLQLVTVACSQRTVLIAHAVSLHLHAQHE